MNAPTPVSVTNMVTKQDGFSLNNSRLLTPTLNVDIYVHFYRVSKKSWPS